MGFFSDLKEDLSQAVNELMPEEDLDAALADTAQDKDLLSGTQTVEDVLMAQAATDSVDLSSMLDQLEEPSTVDWELLENEVVSPVQTVETVEETVEMPAAEPEQTPEPIITKEWMKEPEEQIMEASFIEEAVIEPEAVMTEEQELEPDLAISELSGGEEETMDVQIQEQVQEPVNRVAVDETAVVTEGMTITGDIVSHGSMELIGTVNGNLDIYGKLNITGNITGDSRAAEIYAEGANIAGEVNSQGSVKIGQSSVVIGNIMAASAVIAGAVKGDIDVQGPVILDTTAIVMGNIKSKSVQINNGAVIEGLCSQCYADVNPVSFFEEFKKRKA